MLDTNGIDFESIYKRYDVDLEGNEASETIIASLLPKNILLKAVSESVIYMRFRDVGPAVMRALQLKVPPMTIINEGLVNGMEIVSKLYSKHIYYLPEVMMSAKVMEMGITIAEKQIQGERETKGKIVMHSAEGDPHDIGKNIAAVMLKAAGFDVIDLGKDVPVDVVVKEVERTNPIMVTGTALMSPAISVFPKTAEIIKEKGFEIPYMVAGGAVNRDFAESFDMGIYSMKAPQTPPIAEYVRNGMNWKEIRENWDDITEEKYD